MIASRSLSLTMDELKHVGVFQAQGEQFSGFLSKHQFVHSFMDGKGIESLPKESDIAELEQEK